MTWRAVSRIDRQTAWLWAIAAASALVLRPVWLAAAPFAPRCLWHTWTGLPCPACGTTRAIVHLLRGEAVQGIAMNPLAAIAVGAFLLGGVVAPLWTALGGAVPVVASRPRPGWMAAAVAALLLNWAWLVASGV